MAKPRFTRWFFSNLLLILLACAAQPAFAKPRDLSLYPLRIHIFHSEWIPAGYLSHGSGVGNLIDANNIRAVTFVYICPTNFMQSDGNQAYPAKWKKLERTIEIVGSKVGDSDKTDTCEFKLTMHDFVYDLQDGTLSTFTQEEYKVRVGITLPVSTGLVETDINRYPLRLTVLQVGWAPPVNGTRSGTGRGNVRSPSGLSSIDFTSHCDAAFSTNPPDRYYAGRWITEGSLMDVLLRANSEPGSGFVCTLRTSAHTDIYVLDPSGTVRAVSQEEYRRTQ